jgi:hypothetical protein
MAFGISFTTFHISVMIGTIHPFPKATSYKNAKMIINTIIVDSDRYNAKWNKQNNDPMITNSNFPPSIGPSSSI